MNVKRLIWALSALSFYVSISAHAGDEFIYKSKNKIDFIKLDEAKSKEKEGGLKHPYTFDEAQMKSILSSIHFNKKIIVMKDIEDRSLFSEANVEFLTPYLVDAFKKAKDDQAVVSSYYTRKTHIVIQDDRLTIFRAFVKDDGLHLRFNKLYAKMLGDRTTMGSDRASSEARSINVSLELQPGQNRISWKPEELVFDLNYYGPGGAKEKSSEATVPAKTERKNRKEVRVKTKESSETPIELSGKADVRARLKQLEQLKKDELITDKEYQKKRKELLEQL